MVISLSAWNSEFAHAVSFVFLLTAINGLRYEKATHNLNTVRLKAAFLFVGKVAYNVDNEVPRRGLRRPGDFLLVEERKN